MKRYVLIVDDNQRVVESLSELLIPLGYFVHFALNTREAVAIVKTEKIDVALLDIRLGNENGIECLREMLKEKPQLPVIMITGYATVDSAVDAMKLGAFDYLKKPLDFENLTKTIEKAISDETVNSKHSQLKKIEPIFKYKSSLMDTLLDKTMLIANTELPVLITGENGTGKEMIADIIHKNSCRAKEKIFKINCAAFPESLLDNELFGHEKGAYTGASSNFKGIFEQANGGTLLLDEIGDMPLTIQAKILRTLQNNEIRRIGSTETISIDVRFLAATNKDIESMIKNGHFREDLYYRLNAATLYIPPLRDRKEDITELIDCFLNEYSFKNSVPRKNINNEVLECFMEYRWPGNVRELRNTIMYIAAISKTNIITIETLPPIFTSSKHIEKINRQPYTIQEVEKETIIKTLKTMQGNKRKTAEKLGLSRNTLYRKLRMYNIDNNPL
ncbi:sigma-54-dependent Fis family transcriptional regulator [Treponema sp. OMZ 840]|uniref:sigma-54-dependent transcriptional regulator n=1 Tax=Treponema sp. OMZ 840 TaxID=244313 RepID=UPI003D8E597A